MYRIYMPVDMVLAITHSKMQRERNYRINQKRIESMRLANAIVNASIVTSEKDDEWQRREKIGNSFNNSNCMEMFRFW
jgi:tellurite resistance protein